MANFLLGFKRLFVESRQKCISNFIHPVETCYKDFFVKILTFFLVSHWEMQIVQTHIKKQGLVHKICVQGFVSFRPQPGVSKVLECKGGYYRDLTPSPSPQQSIITGFSDCIQNGPGQPWRRITLKYKTCNFLFREGDSIIIMNIELGTDLTM